MLGLRGRPALLRPPRDVPDAALGAPRLGLGREPPDPRADGLGRRGDPAGPRHARGGARRPRRARRRGARPRSPRRDDRGPVGGDHGRPPRARGRLPRPRDERPDPVHARRRPRERDRVRTSSARTTRRCSGSIARVVDAARAARKPLSVCGEMAADPSLFLLLLGLGIREFSMGPRTVPVIKEFARSVSTDEAARVARRPSPSRRRTRWPRFSRWRCATCSTVDPTGPAPR